MQTQDSNISLMTQVSMKQLLEAGVHFGHQSRRWNPKMARYIYTSRNGIYIIDLKKTLRLLREACKFVRDRVAAGGKGVFVGTKKQAKDSILEAAQSCNMFYVNNRWLGGTLTNFKTIRRSIQRLLDLEKMEQDGSLNNYNKKEQSRMAKERAYLEKNLSGIKHMDQLPSFVFVIDPHKEQLAIREARKLGIPVVAVVDTNCDPDEADYPIPGNDDAIRSVKLMCQKIAEACQEGLLASVEAGTSKEPLPTAVSAKLEAHAQVAAEAASSEAQAQAPVESPAEGLPAVVATEESAPELSQEVQVASEAQKEQV